MLEVIPYKKSGFTSKNKVDIDLINQGKEYIEQFNINPELLIDTVSIIYEYLQNVQKVPQNLFKFYIAAYYICSRNPQAFPCKRTKEQFCHQFGIKKSSLEYSTDQIVSKLNFIKILDDKKRPYYINPRKDVAYKFLESIVKSHVDDELMDFLINHQPVNSQILSEDLTTRTILKMELFPEELFRQFYYLIFELVENYLQDYYHYIELQKKYFI
jgi:hypothetical protein